MTSQLYYTLHEPRFSDTPPDAYRTRASAIAAAEAHLRATAEARVAGPVRRMVPGSITVERRDRQVVLRCETEKRERTLGPARTLTIEGVVYTAAREEGLTDWLPAGPTIFEVTIVQNSIDWAAGEEPATHRLDDAGRFVEVP